MTRRKGIRSFIFNVILLLLCMNLLVSGCSNTNNAKPPATAPSPPEASPSPPEAAPSPPTNSSSDTIGGTAMIPEGVTVKRVIKEVTLNNNNRKKVELLTDGGELTTISDSNGGIIMQNIEYDGVIKAVNGNEITVQVEHGEEKTLTISSDIVVEDEDNLGLNSGVEIEWVVNTSGRIESVELDDL